MLGEHRYTTDKTTDVFNFYVWGGFAFVRYLCSYIFYIFSRTKGQRPRLKKTMGGQIQGEKEGKQEHMNLCQ